MLQINLFTYFCNIFLQKPNLKFNNEKSNHCSRCRKPEYACNGARLQFSFARRELESHRGRQPRIHSYLQRQNSIHRRRRHHRRQQDPFLCKITQNHQCRPDYPVAVLPQHHYCRQIQSAHPQGRQRLVDCIPCLQRRYRIPLGILG